MSHKRARIARRRERAHAAPARPREVRIPAAAAGLLLLLGMLLLYAGSYRSPLVFDDRIINPPQLNQYLTSWQSLQPRWLSYGSFGLNFLVSAMDVFWYRVVNVLLHGAVAIACYGFLRRLLQAARIEAREPALAALCAALVFAVHPVAVYGVGYLAQRSIVMATLFSILALHAFLLGLERDDARWLWVSVLAYFLALWSKEHAVMLPAVALAMALTLRAPTRALARRLFWPTLGFAIAGLLIVLRMRSVLGETYERYAGELVSVVPALPGAPAGATASAAPTTSSYLLSITTQAGLFFKYLLLWLIPNPGWMSADLRVPIPRSPWEPQAIAGIGAYLAWGAAALVLALRRGRFACAGLAMLAPWLLFFTEFAATRVQEPFVLYRSYLWMIGLPVALALLARRLSAKTLMVGTAALCLALGALTRDRLDSFSTPLKFWDDVARKNADHALPFVDRGLSNRAVALMHEGRLSEALVDLDEAIRLNPLNAHGWINRANVRARQGDARTALADADEALRLDPAFGEGFAERCTIRMKLGDDAAALEDCSKAISLAPDYPLALLNRGVLLARRAHLQEALADFERLLVHDPGNAIALYNRGMVLKELGRSDASRASLRDACRLGMAPACEAAAR